MTRTLQEYISTDGGSSRPTGPYMRARREGEEEPFATTAQSKKHIKDTEKAERRHVKTMVL
ncbi:uncharacterized protein PHACADRAFT_253110 [Phanerochaete carnosa HHB-10118-sp]|uniref:Uncharacterized protein n=1 Tax=Phanerochaete carnosa (strain HHB-10118-sp) TaxID=650164 RepID=K5WH28_PHACS|nr:uncharacterized protein PHACADRAFT_253110 [Phanerochaete carnosa HHB-10118-sp]EKM58635.1 hypothetical protein PHACADRAFT_253110 [Phanerochaete carnosa HHB-10118-sp]